MPSRRRIAFSLTPLLDLFLVVLFASSIQTELQANALVEAQRDLVEEARVQEAGARELRDSLQQTVERLTAERDQLAQQVAGLESEVAQYQASLADEIATAQATVEQYQAVLKEVLGPDQEQVAAQLSNALGSITDSVQRQQIEKQLEAMRRAGPQAAEQLVQRLLQFEAVRNRCTLWDIVLNADQSFAIRAEGETIGDPLYADSSDALQAALLNRVRAVRAPQDLIIITVFRDPLSTAGQRRIFEAMKMQFEQNVRATWSGKAIMWVGPLLKESTDATS